MEIDVIDQQILSILSRLPQEGKEELLSSAALILKKYHISGSVATAESTSCELKKKAVGTGHAVEPLITE